MRDKSTWIASMAALLMSGAVMGATPTEAQYADRGARCWAEVRVLADDSMEGRRAGTKGHRRAAQYVAGQFRRAHLRPGGDDGTYFQNVRLEVREIDEGGSSLALARSEGTEPLTLGTDAIFNLRGSFAPAVDAPLVFLGYGLKLPQYGIDDLEGQDLEGKVVVAFTAAPKGVPGAAGAHFGTAVERWKVYRNAGAVGFILIGNPFHMDLPWERVARTRLEPFMALADNAEEQFADQKLWVTFNPARLAVLLKGSGHTAESILAKLKEGETLPRFELPARVRATISTRVSHVTSENVVGILPGSDPRLAAEHVVVSAHLDHLGIGGDGEGDRLFNGAMDNASGVAVLMDVARQLHAAKRRGARSIVFAAVTAEETGLLGSRAFVSRAEREGAAIVANLNSDMFLPIYPLRQLIAFGLEESDLADDVRGVAGQLGVAIQSDPEPLRNRFIRSDQYSFIRAGVPSLALKIGFDAGTPQAALERNWFAQRYHAPADEPDQPVDLAAMGRYASLMQLLALRVADREQRPRWHPSSAFAR